MNVATPRRRKALLIGVAGFLLAVLSACTGVGGGYLPPQSPVFSGQASFGFGFSCQDSGGINPPTGSLRIQLDYVERGTNPLGGPFSIHGIVDQLDPVLESAVCIGQNPPPGGSELIFLGRFRPTSTPPPGKLSACPTRETTSTQLCRFEVIVRDNDNNHVPSPGDYFSIKLANSSALTSQLDPTAVVYARAGLLQGGNITVK